MSRTKNFVFQAVAIGTISFALMSCGKSNSKPIPPTAKTQGDSSGNDGQASVVTNVQFKDSNPIVSWNGTIPANQLVEYAVNECDASNACSTLVYVSCTPGQALSCVIIDAATLTASPDGSALVFNSGNQFTLELCSPNYLALGGGVTIQIQDLSSTVYSAPVSGTLDSALVSSGLCKNYNGQAAF